MNCEMFPPVQSLEEFEKGRHLVFYFFLWPRPWHLEVAGPGIEFEPEVVTSATLAATPDPLTHCTGLGIRPAPPQ